jgi:hypothetical protein
LAYLLANQLFKADLPASLAVGIAVIFVCAGFVFPYYAIGFHVFAGKGGNNFVGRNGRPTPTRRGPANSHGRLTIANSPLH